MWSHLSLAPIDPVFGLYESCANDPRPCKVNLALGLYSNEDQTPHVMTTVRQVEKELAGKDLDKDYAGILGMRPFRRAAMELSLGIGHPVIENDLVATAQTVAGTAALRVIATFLFKHYPFGKTVYVSEYTWSNHLTVFRESGLQVQTYRYYDSHTGGLNAAGLYEDLKSMPPKSIILFHACGHNKTGVDPEPSEWSNISLICKERGHFIIMDNVYQGFATGTIDGDMDGLRSLVNDGHHLAICHTLSKSMGLYGERVGCASIICSSVKEKDIVESQMKLIIRPMYSNPPIHGARIATEILTNPQYKSQWLKELRNIYDDIHKKRELLCEALVNTGSSKDWSYIKRQKGWFCFIGLTKEQADKLQQDYGIYMSCTHIPVVAIKIKDINYTANAIHRVTSDT